MSLRKPRHKSETFDFSNIPADQVPIRGEGTASPRLEASAEKISAMVMDKMMTKEMYAAARLLVSKGFHILAGQTFAEDPEYWWRQPPFAIGPDMAELHDPFAPGVIWEDLHKLINKYMTDDPACPPPPNTIAEHLAEAFTLGGRIPVRYRYFNDRRPGGQGVLIDRDTYESVFGQLNQRTFEYYGREILSFYEALEQYPPARLSVIVWGLAGCNCEALALWKGADRVLAVDYNRPQCQHPQVESLTVDEILSSHILADYAISYSSFEHDGLGRYGDPIDPDGDLRAMSEARKTLKDGGILLLGVPVGPDCLVWNDVRVYGEMRLPLLLKGWQLIDVFHPYPRLSDDYPFDLPIGEYLQPLMVLRKIGDDYPGRLWYEERLAALQAEVDRPAASLRDIHLLARIWRIVRDHPGQGES